jgi:hypothetical protein
MNDWGQQHMAKAGEYAFQIAMRSTRALAHVYFDPDSVRYGAGFAGSAQYAAVETTSYQRLLSQVIAIDLLIHFVPSVIS